MKKIILMILIIVLLSGCSLSSVSGEVISFENPGSIGKIAKYISPAVVGVSGVGKNISSVGSGVCVSDDGHILTNSHVVNGCDDIVLYLHDKSQVTAHIIYEDTVMDLAILKCSRPIPYLLLGDSDIMTVGDDILAVGTPLSLNLTHTFTKGIVSATNRTLKVSGESGEGYMQNLIQHDASLNPGNSGGPLINSNGEVVGINTLKISSGEGIGFAIPTKSFLSLLEKFIKNENYVLPKLGVYGLDSEIASFNKKTNLSKGFYILDVAKGSVVDKAGLCNGDVITSINGNTIDTATDLKNILYKYNVNDKIKVYYNRDGNCYSSDIIL